MSDKILRMAVAGAGGIGKHHAEAIASLRGAALTAICDLDAGRARALAQATGAPRHGIDLTKMLAEGGIDAVSICSDHGSHGRLVEICAGARVHCIVEKPLSIRLSEAIRMVETAGAAGITMGAIFQRRFFPAAQRMKAAIVAGRIGPVTAAECLAHLGRDKAYFDQADWRGTWTGEGGGALMNQAIHMVDMLQWMVGEPKEIYGRWATLKHGDYANVEDTTAAVVTFASGAIATIQALTTLDPPYGFRLTVHGLNGATLGLREWPELTEAITDLWTLTDEPDPREAWEFGDERRPGFPMFHRLQLQDFVDAIHEGREPAVTGAEGLKALHLIKGIYLSQLRRHPVRLPLTVEDIAEVEQYDTQGWPEVEP
jgi:UDP-N-acetyl-2-amino-2-deoxyglucuronate dehydrogenase